MPRKKSESERIRSRPPNVHVTCLDRGTSRYVRIFEKYGSVSYNFRTTTQLISRSVSRWQNAENPVLRSLLHGNACYAGYLDSQSKIQMFTLFSGRHIGVLRRYTNRALSDWALEISSKQFDEYLKFGETHRPKTWRSVLIIFSSVLSQFLSFSHWMVFDLLFYCVTVKTIYYTF